MSNLAEKLDPQIEEQALCLADQAKAVRIHDQASYGAAVEFGKSLKGMRRKIEDFFSPMKKRAHEAWKAICDSEKEHLAPIDQADAELRKVMNFYLQEQERSRREEEARLRREAEERARKEQERLLAQAAKAEAKGQAEKAEALLERAEDVYVAPVAVAAQTSVKTGSATGYGQKDLSVTVVDLKAFVKALIEQNSALTMLDVKPAALKAWAKANEIRRFPGLAIEETVSARIR